MNARKPNIPPSTSPLAQPVLTPNLDRLRVGENSQNQEERPGLQPSRPGRTRGGRKPPPAAADAIPTTIRFDTTESAEIDLFVLSLREEAYRRHLDKAEVFRELIRLAMEHEPTKRALVKRLR
ncbi:hypothetical protein G3M53_32700 [Streptomyces sp. SID7982]|nr:hypothetical protein [Streptomyces sp. SID7982]